MAIAITQSCQKDDVPLETSTATDDSNSGNPNTDTETGTGTTDGDGNTESETGVSGEPGEITLYNVIGDNIIKKTDYKVTGKELEFQKDTKKHQEIWELTKKVIPPSYRSKMSRFMIFTGEGDGTAGYVYNTAPDLSKWEMGIAIDFAYYNGSFNEGGELAYTIIHEFGHILTLDNTQVDASISQNSCQNYFTGEGCTKSMAYINKLYSKFWSDIADEHSQLGENQSEQENFYQKYRDRFVTGYASTNPGEDIAEVFATFITRNGGVNGNSIAEQKIQLMYEHPELITLRNYIRGNTASSRASRFLPIAGSWKKANTFGNPKETYCTKPKK